MAPVSGVKYNSALVCKQRNKGGCAPSRAFREGAATTPRIEGFALCHRWPQHFQSIHFHRPGFAQSIGSKAPPAPEFGRPHLSALHRIAMHVAQFFNAFVFGPHVEVVKAFLPDVL